MHRGSAGLAHPRFRQWVDSRRQPVPRQQLLLWRPVDSVQLHCSLVVGHCRRRIENNDDDDDASNSMITKDIWKIARSPANSLSGLQLWGSMHGRCGRGGNRAAEVCATTPLRRGVTLSFLGTLQAGRRESPEVPKHEIVQRKPIHRTK